MIGEKIPTALTPNPTALNKFANARLTCSPRDKQNTYDLTSHQYFTYRGYSMMGISLAEKRFDLIIAKNFY